MTGIKNEQLDGTLDGKTREEPKMLLMEGDRGWHEGCMSHLSFK